MRLTSCSSQLRFAGRLMPIDRLRAVTVAQFQMAIVMNGMARKREIVTYNVSVTVYEIGVGLSPLCESDRLGISDTFVRLTLRVKLCGRGPRAEADAARRLPPLRLMRCGRRAAVILVS
jgi:hypothetical protein